jgi:hypothetical protein
MVGRKLADDRTGPLVVALVDDEQVKFGVGIGQHADDGVPDKIRPVARANHR